MLKRFSIGLLVWFVCVLSVQAKPVDSLRLVSFATQFIQTVESVHQEKSARTVKGVTPVNGKPNLALVSLLPSGWVLLSTDDVVEPVLGYNLSGSFTFDSTSVNPGLTRLLRAHDNMVKRMRLNPDQPMHANWKTSGVRLRASTSSSVAPLIKVNWDQGKGWNQSCPVDANGPDGHVLVGCVAVAMAQAMSVYRYPIQGTGVASYLSKGYGTLTVDFAKYGSYNWSNMITSSPNKDIADLLYHAAVTVKMDFGADASGATSKSAATALKTHFGYSSSVVNVDKYGTDAQWTALLNAELDAERPLIYAGDGNDGLAGHAFNIDGYDKFDTYTMYHINWGWGGEYNDGNYNINVLNPGNFNFSFNNDVILGIKPIKPGPVGISLSNYTVKAGLPAGTTVGSINVEDEWTGNTYTFKLTPTKFAHITRPLYFTEENGLLKTTKEFEYEADKTNRASVTIQVTDKYGNSLKMNFDISILPPDATALNQVDADENQWNIHYLAEERRLEWNEQEEPVRVAVYTLQGLLLHEQTTTANSLQLDLPKGIYLVRFTTKDSRQTFKLLSPSIP